MELLRPAPAGKYSPLQADGRGLQSVYLTELPQPFALQLAHLVGSEVEAIARSESVAEMPARRTPSRTHPELVLWEEHLRQTDRGRGSDLRRPIARRSCWRGGGRGSSGSACRRSSSAAASPASTGRSTCAPATRKPWRDSDNAERLDGENGLLLTPSIDHLFDREVQVGGFTAGQAKYLEFHRDQVWLASRLGAR